MSRRTYFDARGEERAVIISYEECRYKTNGICYNNYEWRTLGKRCFGCEGGVKWKEKKR